MEVKEVKGKRRTITFVGTFVWANEKQAKKVNECASEDSPRMTINQQQTQVQPWDWPSGNKLLCNTKSVLSYSLTKSKQENLLFGKRVPSYRCFQHTTIYVRRLRVHWKTTTRVYQLKSSKNDSSKSVTSTRKSTWGADANRSISGDR